MKNAYSLLQVREIFHLEFLRYFSKKVKPQYYSLKGGINLRFFFNSIRYSEDIDFDVNTLKVFELRDIVISILKTSVFITGLKPFGIENIVPPDISVSKQTETTQRFKIHLITSQNEDLFTKIEFSRRNTILDSVAQPVETGILREYRISPFIISHYDAKSSILQKLNALAGRSVVQARDIFDLYLLTSYFSEKQFKHNKIDRVLLKKAYNNIFVIDFKQFRDTVLLYLSQDDRLVYDKESVWDEIKLAAAKFLEVDLCQISPS